MNNIYQQTTFVLSLLAGFFLAIQSLSYGQDLTMLPTTKTTEQDTLNKEPDTTTSVEAVKGDTISWTCNNFGYQAKEERFSLFDKAVMRYKGATLTADTIYLDNKKQKVDAMGAPTIKEGQQPEIHGYRLKYNHEREIGEIYYGSTNRDNQLFNGVEIRRQKDGEILISRGDFSTCDTVPHQHFFFYSRKMVLEPGKKVLAKPIVFNIQGVPVAVAPLLVVPLGKGRRSGFLRPKWGGDQSQGFYVRDIGYYWAINDYMDFKAGGDIVEGAEGTFSKTNVYSRYQYNLLNVLSGFVDGRAYMNELNPANSGWEVAFSHDHRLTPDGSQTLKGNGRFVSSSRVLGEALNEQEAVNQTANATLGYANQMRWNRARLNVNLNQNFNLTTGLQERIFPAASFGFGGPLFPEPVDDFWMAAETEEEEDVPWFRKLSYNYQGDLNVYKKKEADADSVQGDSRTWSGAQNAVSLNGKYELLRYINVTPSINVRHNWNLHSSIGVDGAPKADLKPLDGRLGDNVYAYNMGVNANTKLFGIAQPQLGRWEKIRHVITPSIGFTWTPDWLDSNATYIPHPKLGGSAYQPEQRALSFGLINDVDIKIKNNDTTSKETSKSLKIFKTSSNFSYDFMKPEKEFSDLSSSVSSEIIKHIPLTINLTHSFYNKFAGKGKENDLRLPMLMRYSFGWRKSFQFSGDLNSGLWVSKGDSGRFETMPWSLSMDYGFNYSANRVTSAGDFNKGLTHSYSGNLKLHPTPLWECSYAMAFDFEKGEFSRHTFSFHRNLHCWKMDFNWTPVGIGKGWRFMIYVTDIPDIKLESSKSDIKTGFRTQ